MYEAILEINIDAIPIVILNTSVYTSIYNEDLTHEEYILDTLKNYFQPRNSNKDTVTITNLTDFERVSHNQFRGFLLDHSTIENEHQLSATSMMTKKIMREMQNDLEIDGYINSINVLLDDLRDNLKGTLPLSIKSFDLKQFIKLLSFEYDYSEDYARLITRLEQVVPLVVDEMDYQAKEKSFVIYLYPEAGLSIKEQIRFRKILNNLPVPVIVLTESPRFLSESIKGLNYFINNIQMITESFFEDSYWNAPINVEKERIKERFEYLFVKYCSVLEIKPIISNYLLADIIVFNDIDLYIIVSFLKHCNLEYQLDIDKTKISLALSTYLFS
ncbi:MAG: hypothetical protein E6157_10415 [Staphylococcus epidermidis]|uniref:hypothetical protein n=1 Tax=Staphylococcus TaxID=1279 RepID=UPI0008A59B7D|nr:MULTISPECIES: hypothetical protein [Staphylococcus]MDU6533666.1 hypothetical protein [Alloscardovia omnicolens]HDF7124738.1 hypothetical protein [Staphylococcus aureus]ASJ94506.1 hypothetical protein CFE88_09845 [Staphylococcus epidermidis]KAB2226484.1 hypothetical protein F9B46_05910 [Staphylococcus epidermidis]MBF2136666.1 hypothetical protein [Staphylococcus epidermidis]